MGGRCCPKPGPMPGPSGPCAQAQPPAINTPATAKTSRTFFNSFIDFPPPCVQRTFARLLVQCPMLFQTSPSIRSAAFHHLRQGLHGCRNLPRNITVHRCQQILILIGGVLHRNGRLRGFGCAGDRLFSYLAIERGFLLCCFYSCYSRRLLLHMALVQNARKASRRQQASQGRACCQAPSAPRCPIRCPRLAVCGLAPGIHAGLEVLQRARYDGIIALFRQNSARQFVSTAHRVPLSSARTLPSARDKCALTVPSLNPVIRAISLNSRSST